MKHLLKRFFRRSAPALGQGKIGIVIEEGIGVEAVAHHFSIFPWIHRLASES